MNMLVIALGWKEAAAKSIPKVLYVGTDVDEASKALIKAGEAKTIAAGHICRGIEDRVIHRVVFDS